MSANPFWLYETFNKLEAVAWFLTALVLPFKVSRKTSRQVFTIFTASIAFIAFGITDIMEVSTHAILPAWLWVFKITCASILLICRYTYVGWNHFRLNDRFLIFALLCLAASIVAMLLPRFFL